MNPLSSCQQWYRSHRRDHHCLRRPPKHLQNVSFSFWEVPVISNRLYQLRVPIIASGLKMTYDVVKPFQVSCASSALIFAMLTTYKGTKKRCLYASGAVVIKSYRDVTWSGTSLLDTWTLNHIATFVSSHFLARTQWRSMLGSAKAPRLGLPVSSDRICTFFWTSFV